MKDARLRAASVFAAWAASAALAAACSSSKGSSLGPGGGGTGQDGGSDTGTAEVTPVDPAGMFHALEADLVATCGGNGGQCHVNGTFAAAPKWLAGPDTYASCRDYPGNVPVTNDPLDSKLLTQVTHEGPALSTTPALFDKVRQWVTAELALRGTKLPVTDAIPVQAGSNTFDLTALAGGLAGAKLTFDASSSGNILTILNMKITAPFPKALHVESPYFVIVPSSGPTISDKNAGFSGTLDVPNGQTVDFFGGSAVLTKWDPAGKLKIAFSVFQAVVPPDAGVGTTCNALSSFTSNAVPAFKQDLGGQTCQSCHGGGSQAAMFAMDLSALDSDPAAACAQVRGRIVPKSPTTSQLVQTPTGDPAGDPSHPVRTVCPTMTPVDGGASLCTPQAYLTGVTTWINAEQ